MRLRIVLAVVAGSLAAVSAPAQANPLEFERECSKLVDAACYHDFCGIIDCIRTDCLVYSEALGTGNAAICIGKARPRPWDTE